MLLALKHRGPDSTGFAVYGEPDRRRLHHARQGRRAGRHGQGSRHPRPDRGPHRRGSKPASTSMAPRSRSKENATEYALRYIISHDGDTEDMARRIEEIEDVEILSMGNGSGADQGSGRRDEVSAEAIRPGDFKGTHGIGHTRMATESDVDIRSAHPYWAFPYNDVSVVHNGQITNYWIMRREMERKGHRFMSKLRQRVAGGLHRATISPTASAWRTVCAARSTEIDGVFTYLVCDQGPARDGQGHAWPPSRWCSTNPTT